MYKILANTIFIGKDVHFLPECHSTNDKALTLIRQKKLRDGSIIICEHQTKGKGQRGNSWQSGKKMNLTFSVALRPSFMDISEQFYLNMCVSNAIRRILGDYIPQLQVKWPNDLVVPGFGKIGGVLIENTLTREGWEYAVVGIGLNINQEVFDSPKATSLKLITGSNYDLQELYRLVITYLEQGYIQLKKGAWKKIKQEYLNHLYLNNTWSEFSSNGEPFSGKIVGINDEGKLKVCLEKGGIKVFGLKEISFLG